MNKEETIELLKEMKYNCENHDNVYIDDKAQLKSQAIETVLSELEEKDKMIDLMAECISDCTSLPNNNICTGNCNLYDRNTNACSGDCDEACIQGVKQYFENKVKGE